MNGRKASLGAIALTVLAQPSFAELRSLNDEALSGVLGQAGISIDLETTVKFGEIAYKDEGYLLIKDMFLGGMGGTTLDNILMTLDASGDNEVLHRGFSKVAEWADQGLVSTANADVADAVAKYDQGGQYGEAFNDGDLVIHLDASDPGVVGSNSSDQNLDAYTSGIDFELTIDSIEYAQSDYIPGSASNPTGGSMFSDVSIQGYLGPTDIIVRNGSSALSNTTASGLAVSEARLEFNTYFRVTDLDMDWDDGDLIVLFNFSSLKLRDMKIHNTRGADSVGSFGFASVSANISEGVNNVTGQSGLAIYDVDVRMDLDMPHVQLGEAPSIGQVYMTDFIIQTDMLVYGH